MEKEDLQTDGKYSPFSVDKLLKSGKLNKDFNMLIDGTGLGFSHDAPELMYITPQECKTQADHYRENEFNGTQLPVYLYRHLQFLFGENTKGKYGYMYPTDKSLIEAMNNGEIKATDEEYQMILSLVKYSDNNSEAAQCIGMIQLLCGTLNMSKKAGKGVKIYIDKPETHLHPKRQSAFMSTFVNIRETYQIQHVKREIDLSKIKCTECFNKFPASEINNDMGVNLCNECHEQNKGTGQ